MENARGDVNATRGLTRERTKADGFHVKHHRHVDELGTVVMALLFGALGAIALLRGVVRDERDCYRVERVRLRVERERAVAAAQLLVDARHQAEQVRLAQAAAHTARGQTR